MHHLMGVMLLLLLVPAAHAQSEKAESAPAPWFENPTRSRSLLGHTALPLHEGEGFVGQQAFFFTTAGVGLSEHVSVNVATAMPAMAFFTDVQFNLLAGIKVASPLAERLHGAVGLQAAGMWIGDHTFSHFFTLLPYGALTYGTADAHVTATLQSVLLSEDDGWRVMLLPSVSGFVRVWRNLGFVGETLLWLPFKDGDSTYAVPMGGVRALGEHWSLDLAAVVLPGGAVDTAPNGVNLLPLVSFGLHWR